MIMWATILSKVPPKAVVAVVALIVVALLVLAWINPEGFSQVLDLIGGVEEPAQ